MTKDTSEFAEIEAMKSVANAIKDLDDAARGRVLSWLTGRYNVEAADATPPDSERTAFPSKKKQSSEMDLPTTFAAARPESDTDRALVGAYWFQVIKGQADIDSQDVNSELKQLGHGVGNITRAFDHLMAAKPQLVIQTRKAGKAKQARKKYRVTEAGIARVNQLMAGKTAHQESK
jgi:hypothetical protein